MHLPWPIPKRKLARNPDARIDAYSWQEDTEAGGLLLDVFRGGEKKTISLSKEELLDGALANRNGLREKVEEKAEIRDE